VIASSGTTWSLIDDVDRARSGTDQMRADLELLERAAADGATSLRLYTWDRPTLSIGHFQAEDDVDRVACERLGVDVVRRPTGGAALLHGGDLTYAVSMPLPEGSGASVLGMYTLIARGLIAGLDRLGIDAAIARNDGPPGAVCFAGQQGADLRVGDRKICGSAQVRRDGAVLQHGSILCTRLEVDETDLIAGAHDRAQLRRATVTLDELDARADARSVADAMIAGFESALRVHFQPLHPLGITAHR
jgi:lipoate-protein ligase A